MFTFLSTMKLHLAFAQKFISNGIHAHHWLWVFYYFAFFMHLVCLHLGELGVFFCLFVSLGSFFKKTKHLMYTYSFCLYMLRIPLWNVRFLDNIHFCFGTLAVFYWPLNFNIAAKKSVINHLSHLHRIAFFLLEWLWDYFYHLNIRNFISILSRVAHYALLCTKQYTNCAFISFLIRKNYPF